jgi:hypothetical protein
MEEARGKGSSAAAVSLQTEAPPHSRCVQMHGLEHHTAVPAVGSLDVPCLDNPIGVPASRTRSHVDISSPVVVMRSKIALPLVCFWRCPRQVEARPINVVGSGKRDTGLDCYCTGNRIEGSVLADDLTRVLLPPTGKRPERGASCEARQTVEWTPQDHDSPYQFQHEGSRCVTGECLRRRPFELIRTSGQVFRFALIAGQPL